jgi:hypothetical protein
VKWWLSIKCLCGIGINIIQNLCHIYESISFKLSVVSKPLTELLGRKVHPV